MSTSDGVGARRLDMKIEVVVIPVADVDRAKSFYGGMGWRLDADFGTGITSAVPGSTQGLYLVVSDIEAARAELVAHGVKISELFHRVGSDAHLSGPHPQRRSYASRATFNDPDDNGWLLQEVTTRTGQRDANWSDWYAEYIVREQVGKPLPL
jgi:catechol 2,3-dioxygenase-like lactoylglutathione lyase family enzyme